MTNERWRMAGDDDRNRRFFPPIVGDETESDFPDDIDFPEFDDEPSRPKMSFAKAWFIVASTLGALSLIVGSVGFAIMLALQSLGVSVAYRDALIVAGAFFVVRFVDAVFVDALRSRSKK